MGDDATLTPVAAVVERFGWLDARLLSVVLGSVAIVVGAGLIQVSFGAFSMPIVAAWQAVFDPAVWTNPQVLLRLLLGDGLGTSVASALGFSTAEVELSRETLVVWSIRMPRVLVAVLVGANLALSGAVFQAVTRNELASPYVLGVSSGAGLAVLLTLVFFGGLAAFLPLFAALGGAVAFVLVYVIAWQNGTSPVRLVLAGVIVSTVFGSLQQGMFFLIDDVGTVQAALSWTTGSLTGVDWEQVRLALPWTILATGLLLVTSRHLNVLLLGERTASSLGMDVERVRFGVSAVAILAAGSAIAVAGIVGFVGLIVPHMVRNLVGSDYKRLMVGCLFAGPALVVFADVLARLGLVALGLGMSQVPVGIVTGVVGGPYFLYLMRKQEHIGEL
ncbi:FecCD family ABC transporter permease [Halospeciosus flavus]|uniref:FecCD family ABC transporter permease n=1 Tax=Halospeciosus flavus TaxID=3032283 RepID=A0ABD5Z0C8_9EURY|nr:iron ABC transporter permease [Halospeciosus flavus]